MALILAASLSRFLPIFSSILLFITVAASHCLAATTVKVGVYQDFPLVFYDDRSNSQGVYVDLLEHIGTRENWSIEYVPCKWADCLVMLETGKMDLLTAIAYSKERSETYDFNAETVFPNWGQVYSLYGTRVDSISDLAGKSVAGLSEDIYFQTLKEVTKKAEIDVTYVGVDEYEEVFRRIDQKLVDSGIVPRLYGDLNEKNFNVQKTTTIVRPSELRFAAQKDTNRHLLDQIDKHLQKLKQDNNSLYFQSISRWLGQQDRESGVEITFTEAEKRWLQEHQTILLGADPEFVPFEFIDANGGYQGICADYVRLISERIGISMNVAPNLTWNEAVEQAKLKKIDVLPCVGMTEKRKEFLTYSDPHQSFHRVFVTRENAGIGSSIADLTGHVVAVQKNSSHHGFLQDKRRFSRPSTAPLRRKSSPLPKGEAMCSSATKL